MKEKEHATDKYVSEIATAFRLAHRATESFGYQRSSPNNTFIDIEVLFNRVSAAYDIAKDAKAKYKAAP